MQYPDQMNDNILTLIHFDICFFLKKLENQVSEKKLKFLLIKSNRELFDAVRFEKYLTETSIQNTFMLKDILLKADRIIKINNEDFVELEKLASGNSDNFGISAPVGDSGFFATSIPFECITIENNQIYYAINSEAGEKYFFEQGNFEVLKSQDLAHKSARLINLITAAHPNLKQSNTNPSIAPKFKPKSFKDLFNRPELIDRCIDLLRDTEMPCIDDEGKYLRNKGAFVVWITALEERGMFNQRLTNDVERSETLNFNFEGLNISDSLFRQPNIRAKNDFKNYFSREISAIKTLT